MTDIFQQPYYRVNKFLLCCASIWPYQSRAQKLLVLAVGSLIAAVQMISHIRVILKFSDLEVITETTPPLVFYFITTISVITGNIHSDKILKMFQQIEIDWIFVAEQPELQILRGYVEKGKQFTIVLTVAACPLTLLYMSQPLLPGFQEVIDHSNETTSKSLPIPADYFGLDIDVYYNYMVAFMCTFCLYGMLIAVSIETMFVILVQHACGMFTVIGHQLQRMANDITKEFADLNYQPKQNPTFRNFIVCIKKHNDVIEFSQTLEAVVTWAALLILGITVVVSGVAGFQTLYIMEKNPKGAIRYVAFPMVLIAHQFVSSLFAQKLIDHSQRISEYLYQAEWYKTPLATQKLLNLVIMRAHVPCQITAGKIITMSMENFIVALKTSMSYFAVMRSMQ